jgi:hypothetical protein
MSLIVIGGNSRNIGKTSVVAGLIAAMPEFHWTALKITQYGHGICSADGRPCNCATADHNWSISEERNAAGDSDTSRFLAAGAARVWWVRTEQGRLARAVPAIEKRIEDAANVIMESNSILNFLSPDLYLTVLDPATADFKASAKQFLEHADAVILHGRNGAEAPAWKEVSLQAVGSKPQFRIAPPEYVTPEIVRFVRAKLEALHSAENSR